MTGTLVRSNLEPSSLAVSWRNISKKLSARLIVFEVGDRFLELSGRQTVVAPHKGSNRQFKFFRRD